MIARRVFVALAVGLAIVAVVVSLVPFHRHVLIASSKTSETQTGLGWFDIVSADLSCRAPILAAWHSEPATGTVTYGPGLGDPTTACQLEARHRLLLAALLLGWFGRGWCPRHAHKPATRYRASSRGLIRS